MLPKLHNAQLSVKPQVADWPNDRGFSPWHSLHMLQSRDIAMEASLLRRHFIPEWAARAKLKRADLARATGADKGTVTRWFQGNKPQDQYLVVIAKQFGIEVPDLFRHPDDVWVTRFLEGREPEEIERIKATLEAAFPKRVA